MATAGTLLSDLDSKPPVFQQDDDLVDKILADMNVPSPHNPIMGGGAPPPPQGNGARMMSAPNPNTVYPHTMDPATSTAHLIGKDYPTPADFANVLHPMGYASPTASPYASANPPSPAVYPVLLPSTSFSVSDLLQQLKQPLLVAILFFMVSLPALNVLLGHYLPSLLRLGGDLTTVGLAVKSLFAGFLFWFIQRVVVPLMV